MTFDDIDALDFSQLERVSIHGDLDREAIGNIYIAELHPHGVLASFNPRPCEQCRAVRPLAWEAVEIRNLPPNRAEKTLCVCSKACAIAVATRWLALLVAVTIERTS